MKRSSCDAERTVMSDVDDSLVALFLVRHVAGCMQAKAGITNMCTGGNSV